MSGRNLFSLEVCTEDDGMILVKTGLTNGNGVATEVWLNEDALTDLAAHDQEVAAKAMERVLDELEAKCDWLDYASFNTIEATICALIERGEG
jgi:hypothetical protein